MADHLRFAEAGIGEKRDGGRRSVMIPASIRCPDGQVVPCVLRDMSPGGAKLSVSRRHPLPPTFTLWVEGRERAYPVRRVWQRADFAGVALDLAPTDPAVPVR